MKHISEAINQIPQSPERNEPQTSASQNSRRLAAMMRLWQRMTETFGRQWESSYGGIDDPGIQTWTEGLSDLSETDIGNGFRSMVKSGAKFPPNLVEFRAYCRPDQDPKRVQTYSNRNFTQERISKQLPPPHRTEKARDAAAAFFKRAKELGYDTD